MKRSFTSSILILSMFPIWVAAEEGHQEMHGKVSDKVIAKQREKLQESTQGKGFGPQSPRDIDSPAGNNPVVFSIAPAYSEMNLCNIHFHKNAEHKGGEFTQYAGTGDGLGNESGYKFSGSLSAAEVTPFDGKICPNEHGSLSSGDTIEVHYVYSTAQVKPGPTLLSCFNEEMENPQLRVEAQVFVLVNDENALDFGQLTQHGIKNAHYQALHIPDNTGTPVQYIGSSTGPKYNEQASTYMVTWAVRPKVAKVNIETVGAWCTGNVFEEDHAHGVRNLVINPNLLSTIK